MIDILAGLVAPLNAVLFTIGNDAVSWAELLGFLTGGLCVALTVRGHVANFPVGILNAALFLLLFVSARLWASGALQVVFIVLGALGWWQWKHGGTDRSERAVARASRPVLLAMVGVVVVGAGILVPVLAATGDAQPFWDGVVVALSLAAQWLLNAKVIETWWFWITADLISVPLFATQTLVLTALVYLLFLGLCVAGLRTWRRELDAVAVPVLAGAR